MSPGRLASLALAPDVHAVRLRDDLVILDLPADDYLCLPLCGTLQPSDGRMTGAEADLAPLVEAGLLRDGVPVSHRTPPALPVRRCPQVAATPEPGDVLTFARHWSASAWRRPSVAALARRASVRAGRRDLPAAARQVELFRQLLPFAPWTGECLFQAALLLRLLNARGLDADWVFGVRTWPFLAHCWLQLDDVCLTDAPEALVHYRPILVI